jgi:hypothetical protein
MNHKSSYKTKLDNWYNSQNKFGSSKTPARATQFNVSTSLSIKDIENLYRYDWLAKRIINIPVEDSLREWISYNFEDKDIDKYINDYIETHNLEEKLTEALRLSRLYGGSVIVVGALDGRKLDDPVNWDNIKDIKYFTVLDRYQIYPHSYYDNIDSAKYGEPEIYELQPINYYGSATRHSNKPENKDNIAFNTKIHESRLLRFDGEYLPDRKRIGNQGWNDSVFVHTYDAIRAFGIFFQSVGDLPQDFIAKILKMPNLVELLANGQEDILNERLRFAMQNLVSTGMIAIDSEEDFQKSQHPVGGLPELFDKMLDVVSGSSQIPKTRLFGQQLGTLSGASETTRDYYDRIKAYQKRKIKNQIEKMTKFILCCKSFYTRGKEPQTWSFDFNPLWQEPENEKAQNRLTMAQADQLYIGMNVLASEEVRKNRFGEKGYSMDTQIDPNLNIVPENDPSQGTELFQ